MQGHDIATTAELMNRLSRVEGQVRGIRRLIETDADCEKIAQQMAAARKALDKAFHEMLACMIEKDVLETRRDNAAAANMSQIRDLLSKYS